MTERPQAMTMTEAAATRIRTLVAEKGGEGALRLGVKKGGCAGMEYTMNYAQDAGALDEKIEDKGARLLIAPEAVMFLLGARMDWREDALSSGFVFDNPNQVDSCGCGLSVELRRANDKGIQDA